VSFIFQLTSFGLMIQAVLLPLPGRERQQPPRLSWLCWALEYQVMYWATRARGAHGSLWIVLAEVLGTSAMFALSIPWGTGSVRPARLSRRPLRITVADWPDLLTLAGTAAGLAGWLAASAPDLGIACTTAVDTIAALPLLRVAWRQPWAVSLLGWSVSGLASLAACYSVAPGQPLMLYLYPVCGAALDAVVVGTQVAGYRAAWQRAESHAAQLASAGAAEAGPSPAPAPAPARPPAPARQRASGRHRVAAAWRPAGRPRHPARAVAAVAAAAAMAGGALTAWIPAGPAPRAGQPAAAGQPGRAAAAAILTAYPGLQQRGVFESIYRVAASGRTVVATASQASDGIVRQQFITSPDGGATWHLAPERLPGGGPAPLGHAATRITAGPAGWLAAGPDAIWASRDGQSWTLAAAHGITPQRPGDQVWVLTAAGGGFLAGGAAPAPGGGTQAVIWISRDGTAWQRLTAAQAGLALAGQPARDVSYAASRGDDTVIAGHLPGGGWGTWLSTDGGASWTAVTVPAGHGAAGAIAGLGSDRAGLLAVRPGRAAGGAADGVAYFSPDGRAWRYAGTLGGQDDGWSPAVAKGGSWGFAVTGQTAGGQIVVYASPGTGTAWAPARPLAGAPAGTALTPALTPDGTVIAAGSAPAGPAGQQGILVEAPPGGPARPVPLTAIRGAVVPEVDVSAMAAYRGVQVAAGSADGYPAIWRRAGAGPWQLVSSPRLASAQAGPRMAALASVAHGPAGWLAVGVPGPVVLTSADGTAWQPAAGGITAGLAGVSAVAATAGPRGYVITGKLVAPGGTCVADVWWSPDLTRWARARDVNDTTGSSQVLAAAAAAHGFISAGSHGGQPAVWASRDGRSWTTIVLPVPAGATSAVLQQVAVSGRQVTALGQEMTAAGPAPLAELSADAGATWRQVPFPSPGRAGTVFTALAAGAGGFAAAGLYGPAGQQAPAVWTSAAGARWTPLQARLPAAASWITATGMSGRAVTGITSVASGPDQQAVSWTLPAR